jgi:hypothetical protein
MEKWDAGILWLCKAYGVLRSATYTTLVFRRNYEKHQETMG